MQELWSQIPEFPSYAVSTHGRIRNTKTYSPVKQSVNQRGIVKIGLFDGSVQQTRSVALLVAEAFVPGRSETFDTPVHIDGNPMNNRRDNLIWRPRWFAYAYKKQFANPINHDRGPVYDLTTKQWYDTVIDAATANVLLVKDIMRSIMIKEECWPTRNVFAFHE